MLRISHYSLLSLALFLSSVLGGCATTQTAKSGQEVHQFSPIPVIEIAAQDLEPVPTRSASTLLEAANDAFAKANAAQEAGNHDEAYRQYTVMIELLLESDLDPTVFYNLREEFGRILNTSAKLARTYERTRPSAWSQEVVELALRSELEFPNPLNDRVLAEIESIRAVYPNNFQAGLDRSYKYLPYIKKELRKAGLPEDLAWLAMVESQFTPRINSPVGAGGMWQFMKSTGRRYGLRSDYYVDERYDWRKSTGAAIAYLSQLYEIFDGNWPLAVSAYNKGEAGLERAIASNGGDRNLWSLLETPPAANRIPRETKRFYPKLLASVIVASTPEKYGFKPRPQSEERTEVATVKGFYSLKQIAKEAGLSENTLTRLNPQFIRGYTPPGRTTEIAVPLNMRTKVASAIRSMPELRPGTHTVARGETLSLIASLYRVSTRELQGVNNIRSPRRLQIGQRLVIPGAAASGALKGVATNAKGRVVYTVYRGDSLSLIASRHRVAVKDLQAWNNLGRSTRIHVGDRLYVSAGTPVDTGTPLGEAVEYTVKAGDYPARIAKSYNVSLKDFLAWNGLTSRSTIRVGQKLKVYNVTTAKATFSESLREAPSGVSGTHTVRSGESASVIAQKHRVSTRQLLAWNQMTPRTVLHVGDVLYVNDPKLGTESAQEGDAQAQEDAGPLRIVHTVSRGQNPTTIARRYGVKLSDLFVWNSWSKAPVLQIGDEIVVITDSVDD